MAGSVAMAVRSRSVGDDADQSAPPPPAATTPVLSARRVAPLLTRARADIRLSSALANAFTDPALGPARDHSCLAVSAGGRQLYGKGLDPPLIPASNMKLLTAA